MTTTADAWGAAIDAVIATPTLNKAGFRDAIKTVLTSGLSNAEATAWIDAVVAVYAGLGFINGNGYSSYRAEINNEGPVIAKAQFDALQVSLGALPESEAPAQEARLIDLREERDQINNAMDRLDALRAEEPAGVVGRLVKEVLRNGKDLLREHKQAVRDQIQNITGDPDN